ncbi:MAG: LysM peptidoglycan-binding domain-containing protein [Chloroflexota bacterium]
MNDRDRSTADRTAGPKQLLRALLVTFVSVGMLLGSFLLSRLEAPEEMPPSEQSVAQASTVTPFLPTLTPQPSPTAASAEIEPTETAAEETRAPSTPEPTASPTVGATPTPPVTETPASPASCTSPAGWRSYTVRRGDTLAGLARRAGVTTAELMRGNCLSTSTLRSGDAIYVPASFFAQPVPVPTVCGPPLDWVSYTVQPEDSLYSIARRFNVGVETIQRANCLPSPAIRVGQVLYVPSGVSVSLPGRYPAPVLLSPDDGARFPAGQEVEVRWRWEGELGEGEVFDVRLWREGAPHYGVGWTKNDIYAVSGEAGVTYYWSVAVIRGEGGRMLAQLSPESPPRKLVWGTGE